MSIYCRGFFSTHFFEDEFETSTSLEVLGTSLFVSGAVVMELSLFLSVSIVHCELVTQLVLFASYFDNL